MKRMPEQIETLLTQLEAHHPAKRYSLVVDSLWFLYRLFDDPCVNPKGIWIDRLCKIALQTLPVIDRQVRVLDMDVECRNHLSSLANHLVTFSAKTAGCSANVRLRLKQLLKGSLEPKPPREVVWHDVLQLDWKKSSNSSFKILEALRIRLRTQLNKEIKSLPIHPNEIEKKEAYWTSLQCYFRMLLPGLSVAIYQRPTAHHPKRDAVEILASVNFHWWKASCLCYRETNTHWVGNVCMSTYIGYAIMGVYQKTGMHSPPLYIERRVLSQKA